MKFFILIFLTAVCLNTPIQAQTAVPDTGLVKEIEKMFREDQFWRKEFLKMNKKEKTPYDAAIIQEKWAKADSLNEIKAKAIITRYGYPGYNLVGEAASGKFWAIIQHCDNDIPFQTHVLALMKKEIAHNNADKRNYAYLTDRVLANKNQKQLYGTQVTTDKQTGKAVPLPLKDAKKVDKLRRQMGMEPLAEYLKSYN